MQQIPFYILSALIVIAPLIFSPRSSELFEFPKLLTIYLTAAFLMPFILLRLSGKGVEKTKIHKIDSLTILTLVSIAVFLISQGISTWFSIDRHTSLFGYYSRFNGGLLSLISYSIIGIGAYLFLNTNRVKRILIVSLITSAAVALWALPSKFGHDFICLLAQGSFTTSCWTADFNPMVRLFSTLGQPNWFASYLLVNLFICAYFIIQLIHSAKTKYNRTILFLLYTLFALLSIELVWTQSRSAILSYVLLIPSFALWYALRHRDKIKEPKILTFAGIAVILIAYCLIQITPFVQELKRLSEKKTSVPVTKTQQTKTEVKETGITPSSSIRTIVWSGAWELGKRYPLFGTGVETFAYSYNFVRPSSHNLTSEWNFVYNKAHNELLNFLATTGWVGLGAYIFMYLVFLWLGVVLFRSKKRDKELYAAVYIAMLGALFITNLFGFATTVNNLFLFILPATALILLRPEEVEETPYKFSGFHLFFSFTWVALVSIYLLNYFTADYYFARSREQKLLDNTGKAYSLAQQAIVIREEPVYLDQQAYTLSQLSAALKLQGQESQAQELARQALEMNDKTLLMSPYNVYFLNTRAKIYYLLHLAYIEKKDKSQEYLKKAIKALEDASRLAPTDPKAPYMEAVFLSDDDPDRAQKLLDKALLLKPDYDPAIELKERLQ